MPIDFGWRYIAWFAWSHSITGLMILQGIFAGITLDPTLVPHDASHWILIGNAALTIAVSQIKRATQPQPPPPTKAPT